MKHLWGKIFLKQDYLLLCACLKSTENIETNWGNYWNYLYKVMRENSILRTIWKVFFFQLGWPYFHSCGLILTSVHFYDRKEVSEPNVMRTSIIFLHKIIKRNVNKIINFLKIIELYLKSIDIIYHLQQ